MVQIPRTPDLWREYLREEFGSLLRQSSVVDDAGGVNYSSDWRQIRDDVLEHRCQLIAIRYVRRSDMQSDTLFTEVIESALHGQARTSSSDENQVFGTPGR